VGGEQVLAGMHAPLRPVHTSHSKRALGHNKVPTQWLAGWGSMLQQQCYNQHMLKQPRKNATACKKDALDHLGQL
jgi:hypothetical protein